MRNGNARWNMICSGLDRSIAQLIHTKALAMPESALSAYITSLIRYFEDLRDRTHGGSASPKDKEAHFEKSG
ncbi:MAG: hypothetical protein DMG97_33210 [Acidobacteria bacterium]|nr:MAG: hypothetical protein DMG97_33210 [Acidobacteriota bacterium]